MLTGQTAQDVWEELIACEGYQPIAGVGDTARVGLGVAVLMTGWVPDI